MALQEHIRGLFFLFQWQRPHDGSVSLVANDKEKIVNMQNGRDVEEEEAHASLGWVYRDWVQEVHLGSGVRLPKKRSRHKRCEVHESLMEFIRSVPNVDMPGPAVKL